MGEIAEMVYEGTLCQGCYCPIDDMPETAGPCGYPRWCYACGGDPETNGASQRSERRRSRPGRSKKKRIEKALREGRG